MTPEEQARFVDDVRIVLEGFDRGVFVRNIANDPTPDWAIQLVCYIAALGRLAKLTAPAESVATLRPANYTRRPNE